MYNTSKREITEEMYNRAINEHGGYLASEDESKVFSVCEICGYGVYGMRVFKEDGKFYVHFWMGSTCD